MALDEPNDLDCRFDIEGFQFLINKEFLQKSYPVDVDYNGRSYKINLWVEIPLFRKGILTTKKMRTSQVVDLPIQEHGVPGSCSCLTG